LPEPGSPDRQKDKARDRARTTCAASAARSTSAALRRGSKAIGAGAFAFSRPPRARRPFSRIPPYHPADRWNARLIRSPSRWELAAPASARVRQSCALPLPAPFRSPRRAGHFVPRTSLRPVGQVAAKRQFRYPNVYPVDVESGLVTSKFAFNSLIFMARPERFELPTLGSEDRCSIQLSYGRISVSHSMGHSAHKADRSGRARRRRR
jgi:hypothetical protein